MKILLTLCALLLASSSNVFAQQEEPTRSQWEKEMKEAIEKVTETLGNLEFPQIDMESLIIDIQAEMPTKEEMNLHKEKLSEAIKKLKEIDLNHIEQYVEDLEEELEGIIEDHDIEILLPKKPKQI